MNTTAFSQILTTNLPFQQKVEQMVQLTMRSFQADLCVLQKYETSGALTVLASSPNVSGLRNRIPVEKGSMMAQWRSTGQLVYNSVPEQFAPLANQAYASLFCIPLIMGADLLGLLSCYFLQPQEESAYLLDLLAGIANQIAVAIYTAGLEKSFEERSQVEDLDASSLVHYLRTGAAPSSVDWVSVSKRLGYNFTNPHIVVDLEVLEVDNDVPSFEAVFPKLQNGLQKAFLGSVLVGKSRFCTALVDVTHDGTGPRLKKRFGEFVKVVSSQAQVRVGYSNSCIQVTDYPRGFIEALDARVIGQYLPTPASVTHFDDLGVYRQLYFLARTETLSDQFQEAVQRLVSHDQKRSAELLSTLETYLDCGCHIEDASKKLVLHRNTLIQRREKIQTLLEPIDLADQSQWLPLQMAIKIHRIRQKF